MVHQRSLSQRLSPLQIFSTESAGLRFCKIFNGSTVLQDLEEDCMNICYFLLKTILHNNHNFRCHSCCSTNSATVSKLSISNSNALSEIKRFSIFTTWITRILDFDTLLLQKFGVGKIKVFDRSLICLPRLHLFYFIITI